MQESLHTPAISLQIEADCYGGYQCSAVFQMLVRAQEPVPVR